MSQDKKNRDILKEYFETGDRPTQTQFEQLIDSGINQIEDQIHVDNSNQNNPKVGIGTATPQNRLEISSSNGSDTGLRLPTGAGNNKVLASNIDGDASWIDKTTITDGLWKKATNQRDIQNGNSGNVGVGTSIPQNKLEVNGSGGVGTGLRLPTGSGNDRLLTSDSNGNGIWKNLNQITNGLWKAASNPNDILNGNSGSVGVGVSSVASGQKLHVYGNSRLENNMGQLNLTDNSNSNPSLTVEQKKTTLLEYAGSVRYEQMWGNQYGAYIRTNANRIYDSLSNPNPNPIGSIESVSIGTDKGSLWLSSGADSPIIFFPGVPDWMNSGGMIDKDGNWFLNGKTRITENLGNPNTAIPSNHLLEVEGDTNLKGKLLVNDEKPFNYKTFWFSIKNLIDNGFKIDTGEYYNDYGSAIVAAFQFPPGAPKSIYVNNSGTNGEWQIGIEFQDAHADSLTTPNCRVSILFAKSELVE